jgi:hypothetical protein
MLFFTASAAHAQYPLPTDGPYSRPPGVGMMPYGGGDVTQMWPPNTPPNFYPYPGISPYGPTGGFTGGALGVDQTYMSDGLWFRQFLNQHRDYHFSLEATHVRFRNPGDALIGSPHQDINPWRGSAPLGVPFSAEELLLGGIPEDGLGFLLADPRVFPIPLVDLPIVIPTDYDAFKFPIRNMGIFDNFDSTGLFTRWGFTNQDGTGVNWNFNWQFEQDVLFQLGSDNINGIPVTEDVTAALDGLNLLTKRGAIPLDNGEPGPFDPISGTGSTAKYDVLYRVQFRTQSGGTNLSFYSTPTIRNDWMQVKPMWGVRYTYLAERFAFRGIDSGYDYDIDDSTGDGSFRPVAGTIILLYPQYEANIESTVDSHLFGPELGLRFDLGEGDSFHVWGESIAGLAFNNETLRVRGRNIGDPMYDAQLLLLQLPLLAVPRMFTNPTEFDDRDSHFHVSPIFTQSVNADIDIFDEIPVLNEWSMLQNAKFRMGWQFFLAGHVARPADSIDWKGFPLFPEVNAKYKNWYSHQFNFGVNWEY